MSNLNLKKDRFEFVLKIPNILIVFPFKLKLIKYIFF